jgi:hypothetical protein
MCTTVGKKERLQKRRNLRAFRSLSRQAPLLWFLLPPLARASPAPSPSLSIGTQGRRNHEWVCGSDSNREKRGEISIIFLRIWSWCQLVCLHCSKVVATRNNNAGFGARGPLSRVVFGQKQGLGNCSPVRADGDEVNKGWNSHRKEGKAKLMCRVAWYVYVLLRCLIW